MVVEPIDYSASTGRALLQGLTAGRAIQGMRQTSQEMDAAAQQRERQQAAYTALQNARPEDLPALRMQHPEFADLIQKEIGIQDAEHATFVNKALNKISIAAATGNPAMIQTAIEQNKPALMSFGVDPQEAIQMAHNDPQQFGSLLKASMYATMPIEKQVDAQQKEAELKEDARQADMENARGWANIQNAQLDRAQRAQMHNDNVALKLQELGMKQQESGKIDPKLVRDLNSDINGFSKNYSAMRSASDNLQALGKRNTPAAQLGMIFNYMKSLDPQSVVREGEQVQVKRTDGIFGTLGNYVSQLSNGKMLNNEQVQDLINTSKLMANTEGEKFNQQMDDYLSTYGDSLPSGLTKQLQSRKAKLYEDIQQPAQQQTQQATSGGQTFREGMTAKNPKTGQKIIYRNGQWQPM